MNKQIVPNRITFITGHPGTGKTHMLNEFKQFINIGYDYCNKIRHHKPKCYEVDDLSMYSTDKDFYHDEWILPDRIAPYLKQICVVRPVYLFGYAANLNDIVYAMDYEFDCRTSVYIINPGPDLSFYVMTSLLRDLQLNRRVTRSASDYEKFATHPFELDYNPTAIPVTSGNYDDILATLQSKADEQRDEACKQLCLQE